MRAGIGALLTGAGYRPFGAPDSPKRAVRDRAQAPGKVQMHKPESIAGSGLRICMAPMDAPGKGRVGIDVGHVHRRQLRRQRFNAYRCTGFPPLPDDSTAPATSISPSYPSRMGENSCTLPGHALRRARYSPRSPRLFRAARLLRPSSSGGGRYAPPHKDHLLTAQAR
jgi:hypothetical protein